MRKKDHYTELAKKYGLRSRAYFKLMDMDKRYKLFKPGDIVIDIGAAPGGWIKYSLKRIGFDGLVIGIDFRDIEPFNEPNVFILKKDIFDDNILREIRNILGDRYADIVLSDASPNISGIYEIDTERIFDINKRVLQICDKTLKVGGTLVLKTFEGRHERKLVKLIRNRFKKVIKYKPTPSRKRSSETYYIGKYHTLE